MGNSPSIIQKYKDYSTAAKIPQFEHPPKLADQTRKALIKETAKRPFLLVSKINPNKLK